MEKQKKFSEKLKEFKNSGTFLIIALVTGFIFLFGLGFLVSWNFLSKPMSEKQFEYCESVANEVYSTNKMDIDHFEVVKISKTSEEIRVEMKKNLLRGYVVVNLSDGNVERNYENAKAITYGIIGGIVTPILVLWEVVFLWGINSKSGKRKRK